MNSNHDHSFGANDDDASLGTFPAQYSLDDGGEGNNKKPNRLKAGRFSKHHRNLSSGDSNSVASGASSEGLSSIIMFLNDLEKQPKKQERTMSTSERSIFSAASSLAYSEMSNGTPTNSEGGGTYDGSYLVGTKLLGSLLGEHHTNSDSDLNAFVLPGPQDKAPKETKIVSDAGLFHQESYTAEVTLSPLSTTAIMETAVSSNNSINPGTTSFQVNNGNETAVPLNNASNTATTVPRRTNSIASNTTSNTSNSASTPVPSSPAAAPRRKKKNSRKEVLEEEEESYFQEQSLMSRMLCGWDLGEASKYFCGLQRE